MLFHEKVFYFQHMNCCIFKKISSSRKQIQCFFQYIVLFNVTLKKAMVEINAIRTVLLWEIMKSICNKSEEYHDRMGRKKSGQMVFLMRTYHLPRKQNTKVNNKLFLTRETKFHHHSVVVLTRYLEEIQRFHED